MAQLAPGPEMHPYPRAMSSNHPLWTENGALDTRRRRQRHGSSGWGTEQRAPPKGGEVRATGEGAWGADWHPAGHEPGMPQGGQARLGID